MLTDLEHSGLSFVLYLVSLPVNAFLAEGVGALGEHGEGECLEADAADGRRVKVVEAAEDGVEARVVRRGASHT